MSYYIEVPVLHGKAEVIVREFGGEIIPQPASFADVPEGKGLICVVRNALFDAAGFCYDEREFAAFARPDDGPAEDSFSPGVVRLGTGVSGQRPRTWVLMDRTQAEELSGYAARTS